MRNIFKIDINCDLGEGENKQDCDNDAKLMPFISSCNIACGGHAGNQQTMEISLVNAKKKQLKIGAHPGYPDKESFGRKSLSISSEDLQESIKKQIDRFICIAKENNIQLNHIKLHGALYNDVENNISLAESFVRLFQNNYPDLHIVGLAGGNLETICKNNDLSFIPEGFMDRTYLSNGKLTPRNKPKAVIADNKRVIQQALALARNQEVLTSDNRKIYPKVKTICLHGDNPQALNIIRELATVFEQSGIKIQ